MPQIRSIGRRELLTGTLALALAPTAALAQSASPSKLKYPASPIRLLAPLPPGEVIDLVVRNLLPELARGLDVRIVIANDADPAKAASDFIKDAPDGYRLFVGTQRTQTIIPSAVAKPGYDPIDDMSPVCGLVDVPFVLAARRSLVARDLRDLLDLAKRQPERYRYGCDGRFGSGFMAAETLKLRSGLEAGATILASNAAVAAALLAEQVDFAILPLGAIWPAAKAGTVKLFAQMGATRYRRLTNVPTIREAGVANAEFNGWCALYAPAKTPADILDTLNGVVRTTLATERGKAVLDALACVPAPRSAVELDALGSSERALFADVIRRARLT